VELEQVVCGGHEAPLETDRGDASEEELTEATGLFDLTEDRLDRSLPDAIPADPSTETQPGRHRSSKDAAAGPACTLRCRVSMSISSGRHVATDAATTKLREVVLRAVPGVRRELLRLPSGAALHLVQHGLELVHVVCLGGDSLRHDDLRSAV